MHAPRRILSALGDSDMRALVGMIFRPLYANGEVVDYGEVQKLLETTQGRRDL